MEQEQDICSYWWSRTWICGVISGTGSGDLEQDALHLKQEAVQGLEKELTQ